MGWRTSLAVCCSVLFATASIAADRPHVVFAIRSCDEVIRDALHIGELAFGPAGRAVAAGLVERAEESGIFDAVDRRRPVGVYVSFTGHGGIEPPVAFIPVTDLERLKDVAQRVGKIRFEPMARGLWRLVGHGRTAYARLANGYCYVAWSPAALEAPADPAQLTPHADCELVVNLAELPPSVKQVLVDRVVAQALRCARKIPPEKRSGAGEKLRASLRACIEQLEQVRVGLSTDRGKGQFVGELFVKAKADTPFARALADMQGVHSPLAALAAHSALYLHSAGTVPAECRKRVVEELLPRAERMARKLKERHRVELSAAQLRAFLKSLVAQEQFDVAVAAYTEGGEPTVVAACEVADVQAVRRLVEELARQRLVELERVGKIEGKTLYRVVPRAHRGRHGPSLLLFSRRYVWAAHGPQARQRLSEALRTVETAELAPTRGLWFRTDLRAWAVAARKRHASKALQRALEAIGEEPLLGELNVEPEGRAVVVRWRVDDRVLVGLAAWVMSEAERGGIRFRWRWRRHGNRAGADRLWQATVVGLLNR